MSEKCIEHKNQDVVYCSLCVDNAVENYKKHHTQWGTIKKQKVREAIDSNDFLEKLAELEHEQWIAWSKEIAKKENISEDRVKRWKEQWIPYVALIGFDKDKDRKWARKIQKALKKQLNLEEEKKG